MDVHITPTNRISGAIEVPPDKSISHRALLIASISEGDSHIKNLSQAQDPVSSLECVRNLGIDVQQDQKGMVVRGRGKRGLRAATTFLDCGNSGTTMRLLAGILSGQNFDSELRGDDSLNKRPMKRIIDPLRRMGANVVAVSDSTAPIKISGKGQLQPIEYEMPVASAQVKSAILLAGLYTGGVTKVVEPITTRDHTERMLGLPSYKTDLGMAIEVNGNKNLDGREFVIPGDVSSAAFLVAAAVVVPEAELRIRNVGLNPSRTTYLDFLRSHGANIIREEAIADAEPIGDLVVRTSQLVGPMSIGKSDVPLLIDEIPILAIVAALCGIEFRVTGAAELRQKESDRIQAMVKNLRYLGIDVEEFPDGFGFESHGKVRAGDIDTFRDHRIAMAFGVAGLRIPGIVIRGADIADISFPGFWKSLTEISST